jgi:hypothetical protein
LLNVKIVGMEYYHKNPSAWEAFTIGSYFFGTLNSLFPPGYPLVFGPASGAQWIPQPLIGKAGPGRLAEPRTPADRWSPQQQADLTPEISCHFEPVVNRSGLVLT